MENKHISLILEGGGMRGIFTVGVLDAFLDANLAFDSCYAVSAGAGHACSFLSRQRGRANRVSLNFLDDKRYCSLSSLIKTGDLFGAEMIYRTIPFELDTFDFEAFRANPCKFYAVVTNCLSGEAEYKEVADYECDSDIVRASSSLPLLARMVDIGGIPYLDGGVADSIPMERAFSDGADKCVVVLTQPRDYRKEASSTQAIIGLKYRKYPNLVRACEARHLRYNETIERILEEEANGRAFVIRPPQPLGIGRTEKNREKLISGYELGFDHSNSLLEKLREFIGG